MPPTKTVRVEYTREHDIYLVKYLAKYCPTKEGRRGRKVFECLVANEEGIWPWSTHHTWQSWRERYVKNSAHFDALILRYQRKHEIKSEGKRKRPADSMSIKVPSPNAKRLRREEEEESSGSETREATRHENASSRPVSTPKSKDSPRPPVTPSQALTREPEPLNARHTTPKSSPPCSNGSGSANATKKPTAIEPTVLRTRQGAVEIPSSPGRQTPPPTGENYSKHRHVKHIKVRLGTPSDIFASEPPTPEMATAAAVDISSQTQPAPNGVVSGAVYSRAPPCVADSFHGQVLVDRDGHVPRAFPLGEEDVTEEEEDKERRSPARGRAAKRKHAGDPDVEVNAHHAFSQLQPQPRPEHVSRMPDESLLDRRPVVTQFSGRNQAASPRAESDQRGDAVRNGASPVKRIITAAPPSDPFSGQIPEHLSKVFKFPAPRASTRSPFRPEPPLEETRSPRPPSRRIAARYPVLSRIRRQTIGEHVPSVNLVALSHSSRSYSRSSADGSLPARPSRWSLPAFTHAAPWMLDKSDGAPVYGDLWGHERERTRTSSLGGASTPRFMWTPSPTRSAAGTMHASLSVSFTPHPPDLPLAASHGLASLLAHMSANHGLALSVVEAVYARVRSLREADEVLNGMREAAEGFGEQEIERRVRGLWGRRGSHGEGGQGSGNGKTELRYVVASGDGEESEYEPPETSRAAMWKRRSESASHAEEEKGTEEDEEEVEGRAVEEELRDMGEQEDSDEEAHHDFSQHTAEVKGQEEDSEAACKGDVWEDDKVVGALLEDTRFAQELERKLGKEQYRRGIARLFTLGT